MPQADLEAKEAIEPPKLGKHKFSPLPLQVLATDDITGSLRQLRTTPVVVKDRFNSFQKRGLIQVCPGIELITHTPGTVLESSRVSGRRYLGTAVLCVRGTVFQGSSVVW